MNNFGFNTFCTRNWLPLVEILIDSICSFSEYPITVNCINFDYDFKNTQVISKKIRDTGIITNSHLYKYKWSTLLDSTYDLTVMLDADMIALPEVDKLFYENVNRIASCQFPLFAKHPHNPFENPIHKYHLKNILDMFTSNQPSMKYVYACGLVIKNHKSFIQEIIDSIDLFHKNNSIPYIEDEGILNCLLAKYQVNYDLGYNFFPNSTIYKDYISNNIDNSFELYESYLKLNCPVKFYCFHGCKDPNEAKNILENIKNKI